MFVEFEEGFGGGWEAQPRELHLDRAVMYISGALTVICLTCLAVELLVAVKFVYLSFTYLFANVSIKKWHMCARARIRGPEP